MHSIPETFTCIPHSLLRARGLSLTAKNVLVLLEDHRNKQTGQCNPRHQTLADELAVSIDTIDREMAKLKKVGLVQAFKGQRGNRFAIAPKDQWVRLLHPQNRGAETASATAESRSAHPQNRGAEPPASLYEPDLENKDLQPPTPLEDRPAASAAKCPGGNSTNAEEVVADLMAQHPEPGLRDRAISELDKLLRLRPEGPAWVLETVRRNHAASVEHWAGYSRDRFIPQLWRWLRDGDWLWSAQRKSVNRESFAERQKRETREANEKSYRMMAEYEMWDTLREYGQDPEVWRAKVQAA